MEIVIREAQPTDAENLIAYVHRISSEPDIHLELSPGDFTLSVEQEQEFLRHCSDSDNSVFFIAEVGDEIIGALNCSGSHRRKIRHVTSLGISLAKEYRNQGIGHLLMKHAIEWAKTTGVVTRIQLSVFERNQPAIHLYKKFGFVIEGQRINSIYRDEEYQDTFIMALLL